MRKGKFKFTNKNGAEEQVALETLLDQIVDSPIRALMPNTEYRKGEMIFNKELPLLFWVCVSAGMTGNKSSLNVLKKAENYGTVVECGTAMFITHATSYIPTMKTFDAYAKLESPHLTGIPTAPTASSNTNTTQIATTEFVKTALSQLNVFDKIYPIGSIYMSVNSTNPHDLFGGTWEAMPAGRVLLAQGQSNWGDTYTAGTSGGESKHQLSVRELPQHTHTASVGYAGSHSHTTKIGYNVASGTGYGKYMPPDNGVQRNDNLQSNTSGNHNHTINIGYTGNGEKYSIMQPYFSVYIWKRIS